MEAAQRPEQPLRLTVSHLSKSYPSPAGPVEVLHGLSFEVEGGELLAVTGPSGSESRPSIAYGEEPPPIFDAVPLALSSSSFTCCPI